MRTKTTHTPTPWKIKVEHVDPDEGQEVEFYSVRGERSDKKFGGQIVLTPSFRSECKANAAFIVEAANFHETYKKRIEVLEQTLADIGTECSLAFDDVSDQNSDGCKARSIFTKLGEMSHKAIAQADGK